VTGDALDEDVRLFLTAGADKVLSKPLKMEALTQLLELVKESGSESLIYSQEDQLNSLEVVVEER
jgi:CheY-like chemotaxis protein